MGHLVLSHGLESGPGASKIVALAEVARDAGWSTHAVDYRGLDDPARRFDRLLAEARSAPGAPLVLAGSSLGGWLSVAAAPQLRPAGLFLLAPALYLDALPPLAPTALQARVVVVHGLQDEVVPWENGLRFAHEQGGDAHLLQGDHRLHARIPQIRALFAEFLRGFA